MTIIHDWTPEKAKAFGKENLIFKHGLHERPMFDDEGLARLLDRYPRELLGVFTMGEDPKAWTTWRKGSAGNLSGDQLLEAAKAGRIWLNLRHTNDHVPEYAALCDEIFAEKEGKVPGLKTFKRDLGMLISSANAQVFYHLDVPLVSLTLTEAEQVIGVLLTGIYTFRMIFTVFGGEKSEHVEHQRLRFFKRGFDIFLHQPATRDTTGCSRPRQAGRLAHRVAGALGDGVAVRPRIGALGRRTHRFLHSSRAGGVSNIKDRRNEGCEPPQGEGSGPLACGGQHR